MMHRGWESGTTTKRRAGRDHARDRKKSGERMDPLDRRQSNKDLSQAEELPDYEPGLRRAPQINFKPFTTPHAFHGPYQIWKALERRRFRLSSPPPLTAPLLSAQMSGMADAEGRDTDEGCLEQGCAPSIRLTHHYNIIWRAVQARVDAGHGETAKKICCDALRDSYVRALELLGMVQACTQASSSPMENADDEEMKAKSDLDNVVQKMLELGVNLAGLWCVYAQLLLDLGSFQGSDDGGSGAEKFRGMNSNKDGGVLPSASGDKEEEISGGSCPTTDPEYPSSSAHAEQVALAVLQVASSCPLSGRCEWPWRAQSTILMMQCSPVDAGVRCASLSQADKGTDCAENGNCRSPSDDTVSEGQSDCSKVSKLRAVLSLCQKGLSAMTSREAFPHRVSLCRSSECHSLPDDLLSAKESFERKAAILPRSFELGIDEIAVRKFCNEMNNVVIQLDELEECMPMEMAKNNVPKEEKGAARPVNDAKCFVDETLHHPVSMTKSDLDMVAGEENGVPGVSLCGKERASAQRIVSGTNGTSLTMKNAEQEFNGPKLKNGQVHAFHDSLLVSNREEGAGIGGQAKSYLVVNAENDRTCLSDLVSELAAGESNMICPCSGGRTDKPVCRVEWACDVCRSIFRSHHELKEHHDLCTQSCVYSTDRTSAVQCGPYTMSLKKGSSASKDITAKVGNNPPQHPRPCEPLHFEQSEAFDVLDYLVELFTVTEEDMHFLPPSRSDSKPEGTESHNVKCDQLPYQTSAHQANHSTSRVPSFTGQVGMRCLHCRDERYTDVTDSVVFPKTCDDLPVAMQLLEDSHLDTCKNLPNEVQQRYLQMKKGMGMNGKNIKRYWKDESEARGLENDTTQSGVRLCSLGCSIASVSKKVVCSVAL